MAETLENLIVPAFRKPWNSFVTGKARELWLKGGRGSCKSTFAAYAIVSGVMAHPGVNAMILRKHKEDIKSSVYNQIMFAIEKLDETFPEQGIYKRWRFRTSPADMTFDGNRAIIFHGLDDPRKRKSEKPRNGYFGYLWCEEFDEFSGMAEISSLKKSVLRGGAIGQSIFTFNPPQSASSWVNAEAARRIDGREVYHTTYLDVAAHHPEWLGDTFLADAAEMRRVNERQYRYELLGEATGTGGEIFANVSEREITDEQIARFKCVRHGMDFGFTNDPTTLMSVAYDSREKTIYVFGEWYAHGQFTDGIEAALRERGLGSAAVVADSAEQRVIGELRYRGLQVRPCWKSPKGWREDGLRWMRDYSRKIVIDSRRCPNAFREFTQYEYARYGNGDLRTDYPDGNDHTIDAVRYALESEIKADVMRRDMVAPRVLNFARR